ncbi:MAG: gluconolaconase [Mycobacterium sp.]|nr:gluconolaconase [Mycobacterium sp.]
MVGALGLAACSGPGAGGAPASRSPGPDRSRAGSTVGGLPAAPGPVVRLGSAAGLAVGAPFDTPRRVTLPPGWTAEVWARVPGARLAAATPEGDLLVSQPGQGSVALLHPAAVPSAAPAVTSLVRGLDQPHGLALDLTAPGGPFLYVAESNAIDRYVWRGDGTLGARTIVLSGLPDSRSPELHGRYAHALKSVMVGPDHTVYVTVGSTGNVSVEDRTASPPRAVVLAVPFGATLPATRAATFAQGIRNGEGLAIAPDGSLWTAVNERDDLGYPVARPGAPLAVGQVDEKYVRDHPAEAVARLTPGRELGWPYCEPDPDTLPGSIGGTQHLQQLRFARDVQFNADGSKLDCATLPRVEQGLPAHSAPLGLSFPGSTTGVGVAAPPLPAPYGAGALVGVHGSWDRTPPRAPQVTFLPWQGTGLGGQVTLVGGFQDASGDRWGRPVDALMGRDGALYVTDDAAGAVYRIVPPGGGQRIS